MTHHFEIASSDIIGDDFEIVLRNSITGHKMRFVGSKPGLSMKRGGRVSDAHVRRLAERLVRAVTETEMEMEA